jgi:hypothetical protein
LIDKNKKEDQYQEIISTQNPDNMGKKSPFGKSKKSAQEIIRE